MDDEIRLLTLIKNHYKIKKTGLVLVELLKMYQSYLAGGLKRASAKRTRGPKPTETSWIQATSDDAENQAGVVIE